MSRVLQPADIITKDFRTGDTTGGTEQSKQLVIMAAAAVYGQAYNGARAANHTPTDARAEARAAAQDFLNMEFKRE